MYTISMNQPQPFFTALGIHNNEEGEKYINELVAVDMYRNGLKSLGLCAEFAGMDKENFIQLLAKHEVSIFNFKDDEEFLKEFNNA